MLIGLHGRARSGKDTAYEFIAEWAKEQGRSAQRDAFADRLKVSAARALGCDGTWKECIDWMNNLKIEGQVTAWYPTSLDKSEGKGKTISGREFLQRYGTEAHREVFDKEFWVQAVLDHYDASHSGLLVVTDVRFDNEATAIRRAGGSVWHIVRPEGGIAESAHASEQPISDDLIDITITNDGSLDHFRDLIMSTLDREF